jgi:hypothetical protein
VRRKPRIVVLIVTADSTVESTLKDPTSSEYDAAYQLVRELAGVKRKAVRK